MHVAVRAFWQLLDAGTDGVRTLPVTACYRRVVDLVGRQFHERRVSAQTIVDAKGPRAPTSVFQRWWDDVGDATARVRGD